MKLVSKLLVAGVASLSVIGLGTTRPAEAAHHHHHRRAYVIYWRSGPDSQWVLYPQSYPCPVSARRAADWLEANYNVETFVRRR
jgi:hypothetical protein